MLPIVTLPDERLFKSSTEITQIDDKLRNFARDMIDTMHEADGVGLAAIQVGASQRLFVVHVPKDQPRVFINPRIILLSEETGPYEEGCLSIPGVYSDVIRPLEVQIIALDIEGKEFTLDADDLLARVIQHEFDHLNGKLFYQHLKPRQQERFLKIYEREHAVAGA